MTTTVPRHSRLALLLATALAGCPAPAASPAEAWRRLASAVARGDVDAAWDQLSLPTRERLDRAAGELAAARGEPAPADGRLFAFLNAAQLHARAVGVVADQSVGGRASVVVTDDTGVRQTLTAVYEHGVWKADLAAELDAACAAARMPPPAGR